MVGYDCIYFFLYTHTHTLLYTCLRDLVRQAFHLSEVSDCLFTLKDALRANIAITTIYTMSFHVSQGVFSFSRPCNPFLQWSTLCVGGSLFDFPSQAFSIFPIVATAAVALQRRNYADDRTESRALDPRGILGSILTLDVEETCFHF